MPEIYSFPLCRNPGCRSVKESGYADRGLCVGHEAAGVEALGLLGNDWSCLQPLIWDKLVGAPSSDGPAPFGPSLPFCDLAVDALAHEIIYTAVVWEIAVRDRAGLSDAPNQHGQGTYVDLTRAQRILSGNWPVLLNLGPTKYMSYEYRKPAESDGIDGILKLTELHRRARSRIGWTKQTHTVAGACGSCGREQLRHQDESEEVTCAACRWMCTWDAYQDALMAVPA